MGLLLKECKKIAKSIIYWIFITSLIVTWYQNFFGVTSEEIDFIEESSNVAKYNRPLLLEPSINDNFFGIKTVENPNKIMIGAADKLLCDYEANVYATYPFGYYKAVTLSDEEQKQVLSILCQITGLTKEQLQNISDTYFPSRNGTIIHFAGNITDDDLNMVMGDSIDKKGGNTDITQSFTSQVTYEDFKELMVELERIIGNGSDYSMEMLISYFGIEEMTYEEALGEYNSTINEDKITGGFARLFCDYLTAPLGLYSIFLIIFLWLKDYSSKVTELIYSRKISSIKLLFYRYFSVIIMIIIPVFVLSFESLIPLISFGIRKNYIVDYFAYFKYILWWLTPTVMIVIALGMFLTILTDSPIAILVQFLWWIIDRGITGLSGSTSLFTLMLRHNTLRGYGLIQSNLFIIWENRLLLILLSFLLLVLSAWSFDKKRGGKIETWSFYSKIFGVIKDKLPNRYIS